MVGENRILHNRSIYAIFGEGIDDNDMIIIYTAYRCDVTACYGSISGYQEAQTPSLFGSPNDFAVFLPLYKNKP
ncbi:MAG: hypothetical protein IPG51_18345 [Chloroflexi bacterium]|nr:hypothetical protein [Chloroflexota bacterium]